MNQVKSNSEQLHDLGIIDKTKLSTENIKAIDAMSQEEFGHLKASNLSKQNVTSTAGIAL